jgi:hypothetical protein
VVSYSCDFDGSWVRAEGLDLEVNLCHRARENIEDQEMLQNAPPYCGADVYSGWVFCAAMGRYVKEVAGHAPNLCQMLKSLVLSG